MTMNQVSLNDRFKSAPWLSKREMIFIGGCGGIGSNALYNLYKTIPATYFVTDFDTVEEHNLATQFFALQDKGKHKVIAITKFLEAMVGTPQDRSLNSIRTTITKDSRVLPITISAFDNMEARKNLYNSWLKLEDREILLDGRLRATYYQVYAVTKGREDEYEKTLFSDDEIEPAPCTFKQTPHFGMLIGARITQILTNYLTNKYAGDDINVVPFMIEELGDLMHVNIVP